MRLSGTLSSYLGRQFLISVGIVFAVLLFVAAVIDFVELLRRAGTREAATFGVVVEMAAFKLPLLAEQLVPFAVLFGAMLCLARLTGSSELVVSRAAGISVWQILVPMVGLAVVLGLMVVVVFNPVAAALASQFEQLEDKFLRGRPSLLAVSEKEGLWLREGGADGQIVLHAAQVSQSGTELRDVTIFRYRGPDQFVERIDADRAELGDGVWHLERALINGPGRAAENQAHHDLPTTLTLPQIIDSLASPETLSFWELPGFIALLENAGFSAVNHRLHWHRILAQPLLFAAMVLLAAMFALRVPLRRGGMGRLILGGALSGFAIFFLADVTFALGSAGKIPVVLAAWTPAGVTTLVGMAMLFHFEDG